MPRQPRLDHPGAVHHVIGRGIERCTIFVDDIDRRRFLDRLGKVVERSRSALYAWCLLGNHFHLLLRTGVEPLSFLMRRLMTGYAVTFNRRHRRAGHLFQNRFKSILVEEQEYLLTLVAYIHLNPVRAALVSLEALPRYLWSGHRVLLGRKDPVGQECDFVLEQFGGRVGQARQAYVRFVDEAWQCRAARDLNGGGLRRSLKGWAYDEHPCRGRERWAYDERILGSSEFVREIVAGENSRPAPRPMDSGAAVCQLAMKAAELYGVTEELVRSPSKRPPAVQARAAVAQIAVGRLHIPALRVARELGVSLQSVLRGLDAANSAHRSLGPSLAEDLGD
jgi:putative transposase